MHGNVPEWCNDWYNNNYYTISPATDPAGPETGTYRVVRGGGYKDYSRGCRSASRGAGDLSIYNTLTGFRVVFPVE